MSNVFFKKWKAKAKHTKIMENKHTTLYGKAIEKEI